MTCESLKEASVRAAEYALEVAITIQQRHSDQTQFIFCSNCIGTIADINQGRALMHEPRQRLQNNTAWLGVKEKYNKLSLQQRCATSWEWQTALQNAEAINIATTALAHRCLDRAIKSIKNIQKKIGVHGCVQLQKFQ